MSFVSLDMLPAFALVILLAPLAGAVVAGALGGAGLVWCLTQMWIWRSYRRFRVFLNGIFSVIAIWAVIIPVCFVIEEAVRRDVELLIAGCILCGIAGTLLRIAVLWHRQHRGKALMRSDGQVNVNCPECGYAMVGLSESRCPECGARYTLDELIRRQEYDALRIPERVIPQPAITEPASTRPALDGAQRA